jgi:hypothetical protein
MGPELLFFVGVDQIKFPALPGTGERFLDKYLLTNDKTTIRIILDPLKYFIGSVEYGYLINECPAIVYRKQNITELEFKAVKDDLNKVLLVELHNVMAFTYALWMVKDNAADLDRGWLYIKNEASQYCHNNTVSRRTSTARGDFTSIEFSREDLKHARLAKLSMTDPIYETGDATALVDKTLRYQRFTYFLSGARQAKDVGLKISLYVTALEALVSSSSTEVTHQVAERVACLLEPPWKGRVDAYRKMKQAYSYRSKVVHGASFKESAFAHLIETSEYLDMTCRSLSRKYITNESKLRDHLNSSEIDPFFVDLILART